MVFFIAAVHELYHAKKSKLIQKKGFHGLVGTVQFGGASCLEEGLATRVGQLAYIQAKAKFPQGNQVYESLLSGGMPGWTQDKIGVIFPVNLSTSAAEVEDSEVVAPGYPESAKIIDFLEKGIASFSADFLTTIAPYWTESGEELPDFAGVPDFIQLIERSRINGDSVAIARAIDQTFGRGASRALFYLPADIPEQNAGKFYYRLISELLKNYDSMRKTGQLRRDYSKIPLFKYSWRDKKPQPE
jgi:hypothetical protein